ncbi:antibiotic hydrolase [Dyella sp. SG609]|uniref:Vgb family protein n=1 Tax=Dyella sp. SG609 TaxID=2587018 RepID=UPI001444B727|nr:antibiotic hydrolase [Dyella sp. SG609]NKJ23332.1 virginiamycin B lyase [Dyella sp. SG609]
MHRMLCLAAPAMFGAVALLLPVPSLAAADAAPAKAGFDTFATPTQASTPQGVDVAADGNVWYSETSAGKIAVLRPDRSSAEYPLPDGGQPFILKTGKDGIWFTDQVRRAIGHLDPRSGALVEYAIPSREKPYFIQLAPDGSQWFTVTAGVGRLAPDGSVSEWTVLLEHPDDHMEQLSLDPQGNVWFVERNYAGAGPKGTNKVRRLNPGTNTISTYLVPTAGGTPSGVIANADGTVWVSEYYGNALALLDPAVAPHTDETAKPATRAASQQPATIKATVTARAAPTHAPAPPSTSEVKPKVTRGWIEYPLPIANANAEDMRVDSHGRVWFEQDAGYIGMLDPKARRIVEYTIVPANSGYYNIALEQRAGLLWVTEAGGSGAAATGIASLPIGP